MASSAFRDLQALAAIPGKLDLGPHSTALIDELIRAARFEQWLSVIILAAAFVDVVSHEGAEADFADDNSRGDANSDDANSDDHDGFGLSMLRAGERRALDRLRGMRNRILHYQGASEGLSGHSSDGLYLRQQAEAAIAAILPLLELQEIY